MKADWIHKRQTKYTAYVTTYILVIVAVLAVANFLANRYNKSYDATANKQYSLSDQTIKVVKGLKRDVKITFFDESRRFPEARDLLERYQNLSPKVHVDYVDPVKKPQQAKAAGFRRDAQMLVDSGVRKEEAKSLTEEEITGALIRSLKTGERNACFLAGNGEHGLDDSGRSGYSGLKDALERNNYKTRSVSLQQLAGAPAATPGTATIGQVPTAKIEIPKDCTVLIVAGPKAEYQPPLVSAIKTYVEGGGHALFLLDPPLASGREAAEDNTALVSLLAGWGVTPQKDLALDVSGIGAIFQLGPEVPLVSNYESHAIVRDMKEVATAFPLSRTLEVKSADKTSVEKLFSTGDNSFAVTNLSSPNIRIDPKKDKKGPLTLAAAGTYNNQGRFVVVGSSLWASNSFLRFNGNRDLALNMMVWLSADEDLISIRPKEPEDRRLNITGPKMSMVFWLSVVFFPLAVVCSGLMVWWRRR